MIDLHSHTTASDGALSPSELVAAAVERGLDVLGITDHDTVGGIEEATRAAAEVGVRVVPGIELGAESGGRSVHILGLLLDPASPELAATLSAYRAERVERARMMVGRLRHLGYEITFEDVLDQAKGEVVGRPHVARALIARGYIEKIRDAFTPELLADGGGAYVPRRTLGPREAVALLRRAGGVAVLAHPGVAHHEGPSQIDRVDALVRELAGAGLAGIEVDHPDHDPDARAAMAALAAELDLVPTGGTDFHHPLGPPLGTCTTSPEALARLEDRAGR